MARIGFGRNNPFPLRLGHAVSLPASEMDAIRDALSAGFDPDDDSLPSALAYAEGRAVSVVWKINKRTSNQTRAAKCIDWLTEWEKILDIHPTSTSTNYDRRQAIASRFLVLGDNTQRSVTAMCQKLLGQNFVGVALVDPEDVIQYWGVVNPGPPGYEWYSNRAWIQIEVDQLSLSKSDFLLLMQELQELLNRTVPSSMDFSWHTGRGFILGTSTLGETAVD